MSDESSRLKLLEILASREGETVPGAFLTEKLALSRQAVFKLVGALRDEGLDIRSIPQKGYKVQNLAETDAMSPTLVSLLLRGNPVFHTCLYFPQTTSTQRVIKKLAAQDAPQGVVAAADEQTEGRGRRGRSWLGGTGKNLQFSVLLRPSLRPGDVQLLNLAAGISVRNVLRKHYDVAADLKWPNDILANDKKLCGILSEAAGEPDKIYYAVTGIGLNVNTAATEIPDGLASVATSLLLEKNRFVPRVSLLLRILNEFAEHITMLESAGGKAELLSIYRKSCDTIGRSVRVIQDENEYCGTASDITEQGALVVRIDGEDKIFAAADVCHLRLKQGE